VLKAEKELNIEGKTRGSALHMKQTHLTLQESERHQAVLAS